MNLHPCPLCGESKGYGLDWSGCMYQLHCNACGKVAANSYMEARADEAWNAAAAHAQGLRERIAELENEAREQALQALASEGQWIEQTGAQQKRIAELERDNANLKTVMVAAAEEIHAHWDAHCDAEGYGPQNLMRRLEEGIPSEYGYTAGAFAAQQKRISELEAQRQWLPIETAPMDGQKVILFYLNRNNFRRTVMARWVTDEQAAETDADDVGLEAGWYECIDNWDDYCQVCIHEGEPTHWMPLPPPPVERAHGIEPNTTTKD